jgi:hypothetical protein
VLASLADTLMPEAYEKGREEPSGVLGYLLQVEKLEQVLEILLSLNNKFDSFPAFSDPAQPPSRLRVTKCVFCSCEVSNPLSLEINTLVADVDARTDNEVFSPGIHTQLKGAVGVAGQGFSESSATSGAGLPRRLPAGGTRHLAGTGA